MVIPNMVMKFHNFDIFNQICYIFYLSSALACRVESIKNIKKSRQVWFVLFMCLLNTYCEDKNKILKFIFYDVKGFLILKSLY